MSKIQGLLDEYGSSHQNATNKLIHWICVPAIFFSIVGLFYSIHLYVAAAALVFTTGYYITLSRSLAIGMLLFAALCMGVCYEIVAMGLLPLWAVSIIVFIAAWIAQFYGHNIEGKKPSFLKDVQFLLIGPAWIMSFIYKKLGIEL